MRRSIGLSFIPAAMGILSIYDGALGAAAVAAALVPIFTAADVLRWRAAGPDTPPPVKSVGFSFLLFAAFLAVMAGPYWIFVQFLVADAGSDEGRAVWFAVLGGGGSTAVAATLATRIALHPFASWAFAFRTRFLPFAAYTATIGIETSWAGFPAGLSGIAAVIVYIALTAPIKWRSPASVILPISVLLAACSTVPSDAPPGKLAWREGWSDGCNFSRALSGFGNAWSIDVTRQNSDEDYAEGLKAGAADCG
ncbi:hypothetical protein HH303_03845 [Rhodospirillaceae bacterium KN72]|uniref:Uncharacterized protein n=1 Tax=Pacificispira spongiicola TaxID=2729598 RepID=A0A7Y0HDA3_9PROT|nr:hypothetical protein [Pacificispira spongiicola]NMM43596.1 hypothetical protein [Pacificispira spongiicola]